MKMLAQFLELGCLLLAAGLVGFKYDFAAGAFFVALACYYRIGRADL